MADFKNAFLKGLNLAKKAETNIAEINEVIETMSSQLSDLTDGKATLGIGKFYNDTANPLSRFTSDAKTHLALAIYDGEGKNGTEVAEWTRDENGYPCTVSNDSGTFYCTNREELENTIAELFTQTRTGKAILKKMYN